MKTLLLALLFITGLAHAQDRPVATFAQICYTDINKCMIYGVNIENKNAPYSAIYFRESDYNQFVPPEANAELAAFRVSISPASDAQYNMLAANTTTVYRSAEDDMHHLERIEDGTVQLIDDVGTCGLAIVTCVASTTGAIAAGPGLLFLLKLTCGWGAWQCTKAVRTYLKWKRTYKPLPTGTASTGGTSSSGQGGQGPGTPGTSEPVFEKCVTSTVGMGGGPKGEWLEESEVVCFPI